MRHSVVALALAFHLAHAFAAAPSPDVPELLHSVAEKARSVSHQTNAPAFVFEKLSLLDALAADGTVKRTAEKTYQVTMLHGMTHNRLVAIDGRPLSTEEATALTEKEQRWRNRYAIGTGSGSLDRMDEVVNERLLDRFEFTFAGHEDVRGRSCFVLSFQPRKGELPDDRLMDRVINLLTGRIWIDEADDEVARADVHTEGILRLWGGFLGTLESFELHVDRDRSPEGTWFNRFAEVDVHGRRLFSGIHFRLREIAHPHRRNVRPSESSDTAMAPRS